VLIADDLQSLVETQARNKAKLANLKDKTNLQFLLDMADKNPYDLPLTINNQL
jgi:hypothetical protein